MTVHAGPNSGAGGVQLGFFRPEYHVRICGKASWPSSDAAKSGTPMCNTCHADQLPLTLLSKPLMSRAHRSRADRGGGVGFGCERAPATMEATS